MDVVDMSRSTQQLFLCMYALLCKFMESIFHVRKDVIIDYEGNMAHIAAMRKLQQTQMKTLRNSLPPMPSEWSRMRKNQSSLEKLTEALMESGQRVAMVNMIAKGKFSYNKRVGIYQKDNFGHFLATSFHLWGAGNRWEVTENLKVRDVNNAKPCPRYCEACGQYRINFEYHLNEECPEGKIFYQAKELPKQKGYLVYQNSHNTDEKQGDIIVLFLIDR